MRKIIITQTGSSFIARPENALNCVHGIGRTAKEAMGDLFLGFPNTMGLEIREETNASHHHNHVKTSPMPLVQRVRV